METASSRAGRARLMLKRGVLAVIVLYFGSFAILLAILCNYSVMVGKTTGDFLDFVYGPLVGIANLFLSGNVQTVFELLCS